MPVAPPRDDPRKPYAPFPGFAATPLHDGPPSPMIVLRTAEKRSARCSGTGVL
jgi:hypothetical protein